MPGGTGPPGWNLLRACFWLLAFVVVVSMLETVIALLGCTWMIVIVAREPVGSCQQVGEAIRAVLGELITAVLALLVASRPPPK